MRHRIELGPNALCWRHLGLWQSVPSCQHTEGSVPFLKVRSLRELQPPAQAQPRDVPPGRTQLEPRNELFSHPSHCTAITCRESWVMAPALPWHLKEALPISPLTMAKLRPRTHPKRGHSFPTPLTRARLTGAFSKASKLPPCSLAKSEGHTSCHFMLSRHKILPFLAKWKPGGNTGACGQAAVFQLSSDLSCRQFMCPSMGQRGAGWSLPPASAALGPCSEQTQQVSSGLPRVQGHCPPSQGPALGAHIYLLLPDVGPGPALWS